MNFPVTHAYKVYRQLRNTFTTESVIDLGFPPESLTPKPELFPLCQAHSGCGVNKEAWAAMRIRVNREASPELFQSQSSGQAASQVTREERPKVNRPQSDISMDVNLNDPSSCSPFSEEPQVICSSFSSFQNTRNVLKYGSKSSSDYVNCTAVRQTHFEASSHLV